MSRISHADWSLMLPLKYQTLKVAFLAAPLFWHLRHVISRPIRYPGTGQRGNLCGDLCRPPGREARAQDVALLICLKLDRVSGARLPALGKAASRSESLGWCLLLGCSLGRSRGEGSHRSLRGLACLFPRCKASLCRGPVSYQIRTHPKPQLRELGLPSAETPEGRPDRGGVEGEGRHP